LQGYRIILAAIKYNKTYILSQHLFYFIAHETVAFYELKKADEKQNDYLKLMLITYKLQKTGS